MKGPQSAPSPKGTLEVKALPGSNVERATWFDCEDKGQEDTAWRRRDI